MQKIILILIVISLCAGCAVSRKQSGYLNETTVNPFSLNLSENIINQNLIKKSFFIEKAEFRINSIEGEKSGMGTVKFLMPDKFLISIKGNTGIEAVRIYITRDSIMVNDRFNKRLFYGSTSYLKNKYGFTTSLLPVLLGDYVNDEKLDSNKISCKDGKLDIVGSVQTAKIKYVMDCELAKSILAVPGYNNNENSLEIKYSDFFRTNSINTPGKIEIIESQSKTKIEIRIQKIVLPWDGPIEFVPGRQYEKIRLQ